MQENSKRNFLLESLTLQCLVKKNVTQLYYPLLMKAIFHPCTNK